MGGFESDGVSIALSYLTLLVVVLIVLAALALGRELVAWWGCTTDPNIACFDDWYCPGSSAWPKGKTGLASSLFGPTSAPAASCDLGSPGSVCYTGAATCPASELVPAGCGCGFASAQSQCFAALCSIASPGWKPGANCPAVSNS